MQALEKGMKLVKETGHEDEPRRRLAAQRVDVLALMAESFLAHEAKAGDRYQAVVHVSAETSYMEDGPPMAQETTRRILCDSAVVALTENEAGEPLSIGRKRRTVNTAIRRALQKRDGGCRFPGCGQRHFVDAHHIVHWADGGETSLDNLMLLCRHHHRELHEGGWKLERRDDAKLLFFDQWKELVPEAWTLRRAELEEMYKAHALLDVSAETYRLNCMDEHLDLDHAVWAMMQNSSRFCSG